MKSKSLIIVLILIIILFGGYIGYDLLVVHKNAENEKSNNNEYGKKAIVVSAYEGIEYMTVTDSSWVGNDPVDVSMKASIPKLTLNTKNAIDFNKKIYDAYKKEIDDIENGYDVREGEDKYLAFTAEYEYAIADNIVYILIKESGGALNHSGFSTYKGFYYDMKNDKEISLNEIYKKYNIIVEKIEKEYERKGPSFDEYYPEPNGLYYIMPTENSMKSYIAYINGPYYYDEVIIQG